MNRKWHLEHEDGRRWTWHELDAVLKESSASTGSCNDVLVTMDGYAVLIDTGGTMFHTGYLNDDMKVVWDT